jgi:hypothetical protein
MPSPKAPQNPFYPWVKELLPETPDDKKSLLPARLNEEQKNKHQLSKRWWDILIISPQAIHMSHTSQIAGMLASLVPLTRERGG